MGKDRIHLLLAIFLMGLGLKAQGTAGHPGTAQNSVKEAIETFFEGFHDRDSVLIKSTVAPGIVMATTGRDSLGKTLFHREDFSDFLRSIVGIPDSLDFEERLTSFSIEVDRTLAHAWVGYEFWIDGARSHCGVNSFLLVNFDGHWKIVHLIDTRGREDCPDQQSLR